MKQISVHVSLLVLIIFSFTHTAQANSKPVLILYSDSSGTVDLNDPSTQSRPNRVVYHMFHVVLPKDYGLNIRFKPIIWKRGMQLIKAGFADGLINASYNNDRAKYAVYPMKDGKTDDTKMLRLEEYILYKNKNSTITWDGLKIGEIDGDIASIASYAIVKDLRKMGIAVREEINVTSIMRNLVIGRFKAAAMPSYSTDDFLTVYPNLKKSIIRFKKPLKRKEYHLIFSKKFYNHNKKLANMIWDAIADYKSTKAYHDMNRKGLNNG